MKMFCQCNSSCHFLPDKASSEASAALDEDNIISLSPGRIIVLPFGIIIPESLITHDIMLSSGISLISLTYLLAAGLS